MITALQCKCFRMGLGEKGGGKEGNSRKLFIHLFFL